MLQKRSLNLDLVALALLAITVFLGASLLSYDPADPPSTLVYPAPEQVSNACGHSGALAAWALFSALGVGAYYLLFSLAVLDGLLLARRPVNQPVLRFLGWLFSLVGVGTLAAMAAPQWGPGPAIGAGGYLGAAGRGLTEMHFAKVGAYILTLSVLLGGLLLCTDYLLLRLIAWVVGVPAKSLGHGLFRVGSAYAARVQARKDGQAENEVDDEEDWEEEEEDEEELSIVIGGRNGQPEEDEAYDEDEGEIDEDGEPEDDHEEVETEEAPSTLRIRKPKKSQREELIDEINATAAEEEELDYELPSIELLEEAEPFCFEEHEKEVRRKAKVLERTFESFGFNVRVVEIQTGPVIAQFEVELEAGLRLSRITGLADDLAIALRVPSVRIVAPIPGKNTVGIEVPNHGRQLVRLREMMEEANGKAQKLRVPIYLGKDVAGNPMVVDLTSLPHLLIAGRTGTGKSVCLNSMILSMIMTRRPDEVRMLLIDPKMVELSPYKRLPHLMHPVVTDMRKAEAILAWAVEKMEERYQWLARAGVRHVSVYNQLGEEELFERIQPEEEERQQIPTHMPYIVIVADEMADLMMTAAKEVEAHIIRLAQKSRAVGIHLVLATQKPTVDVITGLIKSNLPARIAFQVASRTDSRVVLDEMGAEKLLGNGDMLFLWPGTSTLIRGQGTYLSDEEINRVIADVATTEPQFVKELVQLKATDATAQDQQFKDRDELYEGAIDVVVREGRGSVSLLQRALGIGYGRAARLIDYMEEDGFVGPYNGSQAREVLLSLEDWEVMQSSSTAPKGKAEPPPKPVRRSNKIQLKPPSPDPVATEDDSEAEDAPRARSSPTIAVSKTQGDPDSALAPWEDEEADDSTEADWEYEDDDEGYDEDDAAVELDEEADEDDLEEEYEYEYVDDEGEAEDEWEEEDDEESVVDEEDSDDKTEQGRPPRGSRWSAESA